MKLIDILVEELPKRGGWPSMAKKIHQDYDGEVWGWIDEDDPLFIFTLDQIATNSRQKGKDEAYENMVTREQYEAALAAKNDGWIEWGGGECPVDTKTLVDIKLKNGCTFKSCHPGDYSWRHAGGGGDIISYRLRKPQEVTEDNDESDMNECIGQDVAPVWSGEGLPPVGCECEYQYKVHGSEWCPLECVAVDGKAVFGWSNNTPVALRSNTHNFRPLRSEVDKKREEAIMSLAKAGGAAPFKYGEKLSDGQLLGSMWYELYDAIAAGKVRGVKLED